LPEPASSEPGQRIDKWLWHARIVKTRTLATRLAASGQVRVNRRKTGRASHTVRPGDILTFVHGGRVRVLKILALADRRGPAADARALYEDLAPPERKTGRGEPAASAVWAFQGPVATRPRGAGRPTKRDRRALAALRRR
jgi:ribosome-associated heat shock protein Hsp15